MKGFSFWELFLIKIILLLFLFLAGRWLLRVIVKKTLKFIIKAPHLTEEISKKKIETLSVLLVGMGNVIIYGIILLMILDLFGLDIKPILAGAGILGLAVGFGAQTLVKDLIAGVFIILENQFNVGDKVKIGNFEGEVVKLSPRFTILKDKEGNLIYLPNGSINNVTNFSQRKGS